MVLAISVRYKLQEGTARMPTRNAFDHRDGTHVGTMGLCTPVG